MLARLDAKIPHDDAQARMQSPYFRIHHVLGNVLMGIEGHAVTGLPSNVLRTIDGSLLRLEVNEPLVDASMRPSVLLQQMKEQTQQFVAEHPQFADAGRQR